VKGGGASLTIRRYRSSSSAVGVSCSSCRVSRVCFASMAVRLGGTKYEAVSCTITLPF
jgi:positive regulator of sigma E activity